MRPIEAFLSELDNPKKIIITTHPNPDGDALGSSLALYHFLRAKSHEVTIISPTSYPNFLEWMPGNENVLCYDQDDTESIDNIISEAEIHFSLDYNDLKRLKELGPVVANSPAIKVLIDHHRDPEDFADFGLWNDRAAATAELIYDFILLMEGRDLMSSEIAECLYAGIMTDTGSFKFPSTSAKVHGMVADLIDLGANVSKVNRAIYDTNSLARLRFIGYALLKRLEVVPELNIAYFVIDNDDRERFKLKSGDTEGLVNYALSIKGIVMATIIIEKGDDVKMSFRSVGDYAVNLFAQDHFNGGGHKNASGGLSNDNLPDTITRFKKLIENFKENYFKKQL